MEKFLGVNGCNRLLFYYQEPEADKEPGKLYMGEHGLQLSHITWLSQVSKITDVYILLLLLNNSHATISCKLNDDFFFEIVGDSKLSLPLDLSTVVQVKTTMFFKHHSDIMRVTSLHVT